ncbi:replication initiator 1-like [Culex pipiens pallens]|uniref:replication initiator 1-like n=1 Tax=Culex pipiens pallens TaxID=42434 RepID=UPI001953351A|nr:replication initiator 1-like [Culex pipiens pallens]
MTSICCRLCLLNGPDLRPLLGLTVDSNRFGEPVTSALSQLIACYLAIEPLIASPATTYICSDCGNTIAKWHWFRESCLQNDGVYRKMVPEQIGEYQVVEVKQEIDIGEHEYSDSLITEPLASSSKESQGCPEKGIAEMSSPAKADQYHDVVVKQEQKDEVGEQDYSENLPTEPLDLAPKPLPIKKVRSKKVPAKKNLPATVEEGGEPPVKKKMGRPRLTEAQRNQKGQMCAQCGKVVNNLSAHLTMHNQDRCFQCPHCPMSFYSKANWKTHVNVHTKEIKYTCPVCGRIFWRNNTLQTHMQSHSTDQAYKCPHCPKVYRLRAGLAVHQKSHTQEPDVPCEGCDRKFYSKAQLDKHAVMHRPVKRFVCKICEQGFTKKPYLMRHMEKNHPDCIEVEEKPNIGAELGSL